MSHETSAVEQLDGALDAFFTVRYGPQISLKRIGAKSLNTDERYIANALLALREARLIPSPEKIGARRCAGCARVMRDDEFSVAEDEEICAKCGPGDHVEPRDFEPTTSDVVQSPDGSLADVTVVDVESGLDLVETTRTVVGMPFPVYLHDEANGVTRILRISGEDYSALDEERSAARSGYGRSSTEKG